MRVFKNRVDDHQDEKEKKTEVTPADIEHAAANIRALMDYTLLLEAREEEILQSQRIVDKAIPQVQEHAM